MEELEIKIITQKGTKYTLEKKLIGNDEDYWLFAAYQVAYYVYLFQTTPLYFLELEGVYIGTSVIKSIYFEVHPLTIKKNGKKGGTIIQINPRPMLTE